MSWSTLWLETVGDKNNRVARERILNRAAKMLGGTDHQSYSWHKLSRADTEQLKKKFVEMDMKPSTVRYQLVTIRSLCTLIHEEGGMDEARLRSLRRCELPPKSGSGHVGRKLTQQECGDILLLDPYDSATRMRLAQFAVLITTGMRASEMCGVEGSNITDEGILTIYGKGNKKRTLSIVSSIQQIIADHRQDCNPDLPWLIQNVVATPCKLDRRRVLRDMRYLARDSGVQEFSVHDCRRTAASILMDEGTDIFTVADLLGHSSVDTTRMYDRRPYDNKLKAMEKLGQLVTGEK